MLTANASIIPCTEGFPLKTQILICGWLDLQNRKGVACASSTFGCNAVVSGVPLFIINGLESTKNRSSILFVGVFCHCTHEYPFSICFWELSYSHPRSMLEIPSRDCQWEISKQTRFLGTSLPWPGLGLGFELRVEVGSRGGVGGYSTSPNSWGNPADLVCLDCQRHIFESHEWLMNFHFPNRKESHKIWADVCKI